MDNLMHSNSNSSIARVYDAIMDGKDNYASDRLVADQIIAQIPDVRRFSDEYRAWRVRAIRFLARFGVQQFVDCGTGFPRSENTHDIAQRGHPAARTVYVDGDLHVSVHGRALLDFDDNTNFICGQITRPRKLFGNPAFTRLIDFDEPIGLIHCSTVHHIPDHLRPHEIIREYVDLLPSGSFIVLAHYHDSVDNDESRRLARLAASILNSQVFGSRGASATFRTRDEIMRFFDGLELVDPGLVTFRDWWPDGPHRGAATATDNLALGGVARKV